MTRSNPLRLLEEYGYGVLLIYGEAATGKTTLSLLAAKKRCIEGKCLYVSTEGLDFIKRAEQLSVKLENIDVYEAYGIEDLVELVTSYTLHTYELIIVDSINTFIREGLDETYTAFIYVLACLRNLSNRLGNDIILTAQVRYSEEGEVEPTGWKPLFTYADHVIRLRHLGRGVREAYSPKLGRTCYIIVHTGIKQVKCPEEASYWPEL